MKMNQKYCNKILMTLLSGFVVTIMAIFSTTSVMAAEKSYEVSFKAGSKGTIAGSSRYVLQVPYKGVVDLTAIEALVRPNQPDQYYFSGWSEDISSDKLTVTQKTTLVAQYARIIDKAVYRVNYVDAYGNQVATQKVATTQLNAKVVETAPQVNGYSIKTATKSAVIDQKKGTEITFTYEIVPNEVTENETVTLPGDTVTTIVTDNTNQNNTPGGNQNQQQNSGSQAGEDTNNNDNQDTVVNPDEDVPLDKPDVDDDKNTKVDEDEDVPLANEKTGLSPIVYVAGGGGIAVVVAGAILTFLKLKRR